MLIFDQIKRQSRKLAHAKGGATAIEFALLAIPFFMVIFAILETFFALIAEQVIQSATEDVARLLQTGQLTQTITETEFRALFCAEAAVIIRCSDDEINSPSRLYIDLKSYAKFSDIDKNIPTIGHSTGRDLDVSKLEFSPGGSGSINMLRVYYRWPVVTDLIRPYLTNIKREGSNIPSDFLIVASEAFVSEGY